MKTLTPSWTLTLGLAPWVGVATLIALWPRAPKPGLSEPVALSPAAYAKAEPGRGREASAPSRIPAAGWRDILWRVWREANEDKLTWVAGGVTFCVLLALFPALAAFASIYGLFADLSEVQKHLRDLAGFVPRPALELIATQLVALVQRGETSLGLAFAGSLVVSVWSANAGMKALIDGLNIAYDETEKRAPLRRTALMLAFTVGAVVFLTGVTAVLVGVPALIEDAGLARLAAVWIPLRWAITLLFATLAFAFIYRYGPSRERARWRWVSPGGAFAAVGWLVGSLGFSWYVNNLAHYDVTYGSLGAAVGFMMWIWVSVIVLLLGAELNAEIEHQTALDSTTGRPAPIGERGAAMADTVGKAFRPNLAQLWALRRRQAGQVLGKISPRPPAPRGARPGLRRSAAR